MLRGSEADHKLDIFLTSVGTTVPDGRARLVKCNIGAIGRYAHEVLESQSERRFVYTLGPNLRHPPFVLCPRYGLLLHIHPPQHLTPTPTAPNIAVIPSTQDTSRSASVGADFSIHPWLHKAAHCPSGISLTVHSKVQDRRYEFGYQSRVSYGEHDRTAQGG